MFVGCEELGLLGVLGFVDVLLGWWGRFAGLARFLYGSAGCVGFLSLVFLRLQREL